MNRKRQRRSPAELIRLRAAIYAVAETDRPVSIRHIFYRMVTQNLVEKSDRGYQQLQKVTVAMRRDLVLPYHWIEDSSRQAHWNSGYAGVGNFAEVAASIYRRDYWDSTDTLVKCGANLGHWPVSWARYAASTWYHYSHRAALLAYPSCTKPLHISKSLNVLTPSSCTWATTIRLGC